MQNRDRDREKLESLENGKKSSSIKQKEKEEAEESFHEKGDLFFNILWMFLYILSVGVEIKIYNLYVTLYFIIFNIIFLIYIYLLTCTFIEIFIRIRFTLFIYTLYLIKFIYIQIIYYKKKQLSIAPHYVNYLIEPFIFTFLTLPLFPPPYSI